MSVSPDGRNVYVVSIAFSSDNDAIAIFRRNRRTGKLKQLPGRLGCISKRRADGCSRGRALDNPVAVTVSRDGRNVYTAGLFSNAISVFQRDRRTGALRQPSGRAGCIQSRRRTTCTPGIGLQGAQHMLISPGGGHMYVSSNLLTVLLRRSAR